MQIAGMGESIEFVQLCRGEGVRGLIIETRYRALNELEVLSHHSLFSNSTTFTKFPFYSPLSPPESPRKSVLIVYLMNEVSSVTR